MMPMRFFFALLLAAVLGSVAAAPVRTDHVEAELVADRSAIEPGRPLTVALRLKMDPHWHTYWRNPGDSGQPTTIDWKLPAGFAAGPIQWPHPQRLPAGPLVNYGFEGEVLLLSELSVPEGARGPVTLRAHARWLVCDPERCIPEEAVLSLLLGGGKPAATRWADAIERTRRALPIRAGELGAWKFQAAAAADRVDLDIVPPAGIRGDGYAFFPYDEGKVEYSGSQPLVPAGEGMRLSIPVSSQPVGEFDRVHGLLVSRAALDASGRHAVEIDVPVARAAAAGPAAPASAPIGLAVAVAFAFVGGLILNLMPCVLPVLSIKVLGFTAPGSHRAQGLLYGAGVLASFWLLATLMLALKGAGAGLGWGFQLQSPGFIAFLALLFFLLALNLSGVFEFGSLVPASVAGARFSSRGAESFFTGVLAVLVASPCTAPFMGAALGYSLGESAATAMLVFTALAVGMALPYVLLAWHPRWLAAVPKPGKWMLRFKQVLAFPLYGTVVWLAWVLGTQAGLDAVILLLAAMVALGAAAWLAGMTADRPWIPRAAATAFAAAALALAWPAAQVAAPAATAKADGAWEPWTKERYAALAAAGKPVFVDFTASWCVTCQVNKKLVLSQPEVERAFRDHGVTLLRADWTRRDADIERALAELGRKGIPVYLLYRPGRGATLLPELLTRDALFAALAELSPPKEKT